MAALPPSGQRPTWIEIDLEALDYNLACLRGQLSPGCSVVAVVKDNAYGHGMVPMAQHLEPQVTMLGVAMLEEAAMLRQAGIVCPVLVMGGLWSGQEREALELRLTPVVCTLESLRRWNSAAAGHAAPAPYHLKVDSGMCRQGFLPRELPDVLNACRHFTHVFCEGLMTHLACADSPDPEFTDMQLTRFRECLDMACRAGWQPRWTHAANSAAVLDHPRSHFNLVRPGLALYGYDPRPSAGRGLRPVLSLKSRIGMLKDLPTGSSIGYGATYITKRLTRLAIVPLGYGDGYSCQWANRGQVLIAGKSAPVVGRINMDVITVDVTDIPDANEDSEVVLIGRSGAAEITADHLASRLRTTSYEVLTSLSPRLGRAYLHRGVAGHAEKTGP